MIIMVVGLFHLVCFHFNRYNMEKTLLERKYFPYVEVLEIESEGKKKLCLSTIARKKISNSWYEFMFNATAFGRKDEFTKEEIIDNINFFNERVYKMVLQMSDKLDDYKNNSFIGFNLSYLECDEKERMSNQFVVNVLTKDTQFTLINTKGRDIIIETSNILKGEKNV